MKKKFLRTELCLLRFLALHDVTAPIRNVFYVEYLKGKSSSISVGDGRIGERPSVKLNLKYSGGTKCFPENEKMWSKQYVPRYNEIGISRPSPEGVHFSSPSRSGENLREVLMTHHLLSRIRKSAREFIFVSA